MNLRYRLITAATHIKQRVSIIGGGSAALFLACKLDPEKYQVTIYEKNAALGRKFLVAGAGGFNLTHSENAKQFVEKYSPKDKLENVFNAFDNAVFINWLNSIGVETYVGSSKRVFPKKGMKPIDVLRAIEKELKKNGVEIKFGVEWKGWASKSPNDVILSSSSALTINSVEGSLFGQINETKTNVQKENLNPAICTSPESMPHFDSAQCDIDITIFALGGGSWKVTGSDGTWQNYFKEKGIEVKPFQASNCAFKVEWKVEVLKKLEGKALKNSVFSCGNKKIMGEAVLTEFGIEGSGVYPFSGAVREGLEKNGKAIIQVDLKPELSQEKIQEFIKNKGDWNIKDVLLSRIKLSDTAFQLIKLSTAKEEYHSPEMLSQLIKNFPIPITGLAPIDEAISTVGGIPFEELNANFELKKLPNTYCIGEMVDWDAPTGGYLLQMCFSMGFYLGKILNDKF